MKVPKIVTGSDRKIAATWKVADTVTPITDTAIVKFVLVSKDKKTTYTGVITASKDDPGADWPNGIVMLIFPAAETATILDYQGLAEVELQVDDNGAKLSGFFQVNIIRGNIN